MIYVDSNYWIYWLDSRLPEHERVLGTMRSAIREGIAMSYVTFFEIAHYLRMIPNKEFVDTMGSIRDLSTLTFFDLDDRIADMAIKMVPDYASKGLGSSDCIILATMKSSGINRIATHDRAFLRISEVKVTDDIAK